MSIKHKHYSDIYIILTVIISPTDFNLVAVEFTESDMHNSCGVDHKHCRHTIWQ
jgi:hypothetical protein